MKIFFLLIKSSPKDVLFELKNTIFPKNYVNDTFKVIGDAIITSYPEVKKQDLGLLIFL